MAITVISRLDVSKFPCRCGTSTIWAPGVARKREEKWCTAAKPNFNSLPFGMILAPKWLVNVYVSMFMYVCVVVEFSLKSLYGTTKTRAER